MTSTTTTTILTVLVFIVSTLIVLASLRCRSRCDCEERCRCTFRRGHSDNHSAEVRWVPGRAGGHELHMHTWRNTP